MEKVRVQTPSRIHVTLIDLNGSLGRIDGGIGFALEEPEILLEVEAGSGEVVSDSGVHPELVERAKAVIKKVEEFFGFSVNVRIMKAYTPHCGLGSGTQLSLAIAKACTVLQGAEVSVRELAGVVGRGGTSGIGVAVFERGGFVLDGGHSTKVKKSFAPSSASKAPPPPVLARYDFPWKVVAVVPDRSGFSGAGEVNLFEKNCPIPLEEVREVSHIVLMKMLPAVVEEDLDEFMEAVSLVQKLGFKKAEVLSYEFAREFLDVFRAGMSSTGTAFYSAVESNAEGKKLLKDMVKFFEEKEIGCWGVLTNPNNEGARVMKV